MSKGPEFHEDVPEINIRGEVAYFTTNGRKHAMPIAIARAFNRRLGAALAVHDAAHGVVVGPLKIADGGAH